MNDPANSAVSLTKKAAKEGEERPLHSRKAPREIDVNTLFEGAREISLLHRGEAYSLRITANGKLILTK